MDYYISSFTGISPNLILKWTKKKANSGSNPHELGYLQSSTGKYSIKDKAHMKEFTATSKSIWNQFYIQDLDPHTWHNGVDDHVADYFYAKMASTYEEFRFCDNGRWKARLYAIKNYPEWTQSTRESGHLQCNSSISVLQSDIKKSKSQRDKSKPPPKNKCKMTVNSTFPMSPSLLMWLILPQWHLPLFQSHYLCYCVQCELYQSPSNLSPVDVPISSHSTMVSTTDSKAIPTITTTSSNVNSTASLSLDLNLTNNGSNITNDTHIATKDNPNATNDNSNLNDSNLGSNGNSSDMSNNILNSGNDNSCSTNDSSNSTANNNMNNKATLHPTKQLLVPTWKK
ncbi:hypothetical protein BT96DRAFT_1004499 [Gymnopus androsaceus JB14]|uniref:Uncharacterized protein n=1 Tax=Gymnopus androsaceus JB14 TaxID=1447944 RepID=A0A6A4GRU9_9AGAR|nr:hypothetical protein BT96DRAFT_1004499 [Gymnopus androsaceus JB14]